MKITANTQQDPHGIPSFIGDHLCKQIMSFQRTLDARGDDNCHPTAPEMTLQNKMITNIIKLKKFNAAEQAARVIKNFLGVLTKDNKELGKTVTEKFAQFIAGSNIAQVAFQQTVEKNIDIADTPIVAPKEEIHTQPAALSVAAEHQTPAGENYRLDPPPFNESFYNRHKIYLMDVYAGDEHTSYELDGKEYNKQWLEYNLYQYTLPEGERKFIKDAYSYRQLIDHNKTAREIKLYFGFEEK